MLVVLVWIGRRFGRRALPRYRSDRAVLGKRRVRQPRIPAAGLVPLYPGQRGRRRVEDGTRRRRFAGRPNGGAGKAVPKTGGEYCGEDGQDEDVSESLRPGADSPAESGNERQHAGVVENVQLEKKGEGVSTGEPCQMSVLLRRYRALLLPLL